jgi:hypothetical protein
METAMLGVWLTSLLGATAFSAAGYVLGQRGVAVPFLGLQELAPAPATSAAETPKPAPVAEEDRPTPDVSSSKAKVRRASPSAEAPVAAKASPAKGKPLKREEPTDDDEARPTVVPDKLEHAAVVATTVATIPPLRTPSLRTPDVFQAEATKGELAALVQAEAAEQRARTAEVVKAELERQLETVRSELGRELVARASAEARAEELGDRLASASEEASGLRHKVALLDKQSRQLREALQGRVRALTTSEWHRRRDLEEAEEMRVKLRDVYDEIEQTSLPPGPMASPLPEKAPRTTTSPGIAAASRPDDDAERLNGEVQRLTEENRSLRQRVLGSLPPKPTASSAAAPELDMEIYRELIRRVGSVAGLRGAVVADEVGSLLVGSGDLAEALAAFGSYIKDASARTDRLLPLDGVEEVDIRDRAGMLLSTRVIAHASTELCVVLLGAADVSLAAAKKVVEETLRLRQP